MRQARLAAVIHPSIRLVEGGPHTVLVHRGVHAKIALTVRTMTNGSVDRDKPAPVDVGSGIWVFTAVYPNVLFKVDI